jgi:N-acetylglucosaminyldiphosphoundecaprenol N-acetyl-beta-D-mannosaminyltransferase
LLIREPGLRWHRLFFLVESQETKAAALSWADNIGMAKQIAIAVAPPELDSDMIGQAILVRRIKEAAPTILVVTLGAPASELFVHRHLNALPPCWALCVGQALRVELGLARRAPFAWRKLGLEWLWRLRHEPRRLVGRYASALAWFPIAILRDLGDRQTAKGG